MTNFQVTDSGLIFASVEKRLDHRLRVSYLCESKELFSFLQPTEPSKERDTSKPKSRLAAIEWPSPSDSVPFWERPVKPVSVGDASGGDTNVPKDPNPMHIVHVTAEMAPLAKVGQSFVRTGGTVLNQGALLNRAFQHVRFLSFFQRHFAVGD